MLNNSCCKDFAVSEEMLKVLNSSMYEHEETHEGDTVDAGPDDLELIKKFFGIMNNCIVDELNLCPFLYLFSI